MIALHLLGRADAGAQSAEDHVARMRRLAAGDVAVLLDAPPGEHHAAGPPIASLIERTARRGMAVAHLALVSTDLAGSHLPGTEHNDTGPLARRIIDALTRQPDLYGRPLTASVLHVTRLSVPGFSLAVSRWLRRRRRPGRPAAPAPVVVTLGGGPTEGFIGVLMGCLDAGVVPLVCVTNREAIGAGDLLDLRVEERAEPWLVHAGAFEAMATFDPAHEAEWRFLAALGRYNWAAAEALRRAVGPEVSAAMGLPDGELGQPPADATGWAFYRRLLEGMALRQVGAGEVAGLAPARSWPVLRLREAVAPGGEHEASERPWRALVPARRIEEYVDGWAQQPVAGPAWLEAIAPRRRWAPAYGVARRLAHGRPVLANEALEAARSLAALAAEADPASLALERLGYARVPLLPGRGWLVVACGSGPELPLANGLQMVDAIVRRLAAEGPGVPGASHLRLLCSTEGLRLGRAMVEAAGPVLASAAVIGPVPVNDVDAVRGLALGALLGEPRLREVGRIVFACNPGSKAMNLAATLAALEWSFAARRPYSIAALARTDAGTELRLEGSARPAAPRLLHDRALVCVLPVLIERLELGLAQRLSGLGSERWSGVSGQIERLRRRWLDRRPDGPRWFPARAELCRRLSGWDVWRALHTFCALADQSWSAPGASGARACAWRDGDGLDACRVLWRWRTDGPLGHRFLGGLPCAPTDGVALTMAEAIGALGEAGLVPVDHEPADALAGELGRLLRSVASVEVLR